MQRRGKTHAAALRPDQGISIQRLIEFAQEAARLLEQREEDDAAFYFEQIAEHLRRHPEKGLNESVGRILGI